jgi:hypothetical protein
MHIKILKIKNNPLSSNKNKNINIIKINSKTNKNNGITNSKIFKINYIKKCLIYKNLTYN